MVLSIDDFIEAEDDETNKHIAGLQLSYNFHQDWVSSRILAGMLISHDNTALLFDSSADAVPSPRCAKGSPNLTLLMLSGLS